MSGAGQANQWGETLERPLHSPPAWGGELPQPEKPSQLRLGAEDFFGPDVPFGRVLNDMSNYDVQARDREVTGFTYLGDGSIRMNDKDGNTHHFPDDTEAELFAETEWPGRVLTGFHLTRLTDQEHLRMMTENQPETAWEIVQRLTGFMAVGLVSPDNLLGAGVGVAAVKVATKMPFLANQIKKAAPRSLGGAFAKYGASGAVSNALFELAITPQIRSNYERIGMEYSIEDVHTNLVLAAILGYGISGTFGSAGYIIRKWRRTLKDPMQREALEETEDRAQEIDEYLRQEGITIKQAKQAMLANLDDPEITPEQKLEYAKVRDTIHRITKDINNAIREHLPRGDKGKGAKIFKLRDVNNEDIQKFITGDVHTRVSAERKIGEEDVEQEIELAGLVDVLDLREVQTSEPLRGRLVDRRDEPDPGVDEKAKLGYHLPNNEKGDVYLWETTPGDLHVIKGDLEAETGRAIIFKESEDFSFGDVQAFAALDNLDKGRADVTDYAVLYRRFGQHAEEHVAIRGLEGKEQSFVVGRFLANLDFGTLHRFKRSGQTIVDHLTRAGANENELILGRGLREILGMDGDVDRLPLMQAEAIRTLSKSVQTMSDIFAKGGSDQTADFLRQVEDLRKMLRKGQRALKTAMLQKENKRLRDDISDLIKFADRGLKDLRKQRKIDIKDIRSKLRELEKASSEDIKQKRKDAWNLIQTVLPEHKDEMKATLDKIAETGKEKAEVRKKRIDDFITRVEEQLSNETEKAEKEVVKLLNKLKETEEVESIQEGLKAGAKLAKQRLSETARKSEEIGRLRQAQKQSKQALDRKTKKMLNLQNKIETARDNIKRLQEESEQLEKEIAAREAAKERKDALTAEKSQIQQEIAHAKELLKQLKGYSKIVRGIERRPVGDAAKDLYQGLRDPERTNQSVIASRKAMEEEVVKQWLKEIKDLGLKLVGSDGKELKGMEAVHEVRRLLANEDMMNAVSLYARKRTDPDHKGDLIARTRTLPTEKQLRNAYAEEGYENIPQEDWEYIQHWYKTNEETGRKAKTDRIVAVSKSTQKIIKKHLPNAKMESVDDEIKEFAKPLRGVKGSHQDMRKTSAQGKLTSLKGMAERLEKNLSQTRALHALARPTTDKFGFKAATGDELDSKSAKLIDNLPKLEKRLVEVNDALREMRESLTATAREKSTLKNKSEKIAEMEGRAKALEEELALAQKEAAKEAEDLAKLQKDEKVADGQKKVAKAKARKAIEDDDDDDPTGGGTPPLAGGAIDKSAPEMGKAAANKATKAATKRAKTKKSPTSGKKKPKTPEQEEQEAMEAMGEEGGEGQGFAEGSAMKARRQKEEARNAQMAQDPKAGLHADGSPAGKTSTIPLTVPKKKVKAKVGKEASDDEIDNLLEDDVDQGESTAKAEDNTEEMTPEETAKETRKEAKEEANQDPPDEEADMETLLAESKKLKEEIDKLTSAEGWDMDTATLNRLKEIKDRMKEIDGEVYIRDPNQRTESIGNVVGDALDGHMRAISDEPLNNLIYSTYQDARAGVKVETAIRNLKEYIKGVRNTLESQKKEGIINMGGIAHRERILAINEGALKLLQKEKKTGKAIDSMSFLMGEDESDFIPVMGDIAEPLKPEDVKVKIGPRDFGERDIEITVPKGTTLPDEFEMHVIEHETEAREQAREQGEEFELEGAAAIFVKDTLMATWKDQTGRRQRFSVELHNLKKEFTLEDLIKALLAEGHRRNIGFEDGVQSASKRKASKMKSEMENLGDAKKVLDDRKAKREAEKAVEEEVSEVIPEALTSFKEMLDYVKNRMKTLEKLGNKKDQDEGVKADIEEEMAKLERVEAHLRQEESKATPDLEEAITDMVEAKEKELIDEGNKLVDEAAKNMDDKAFGKAEPDERREMQEKSREANARIREIRKELQEMGSTDTIGNPRKRLETTADLEKDLKRKLANVAGAEKRHVKGVKMMNLGDDSSRAFLHNTDERDGIVQELKSREDANPKLLARAEKQMQEIPRSGSPGYATRNRHKAEKVKAALQKKKAQIEDEIEGIEYKKEDAQTAAAEEKLDRQLQEQEEKLEEINERLQALDETETEPPPQPVKKKRGRPRKNPDEGTKVSKAEKREAERKSERDPEADENLINKAKEDEDSALQEQREYDRIVKAKQTQIVELKSDIMVAADMVSKSNAQGDQRKALLDQTQKRVEANRTKIAKLEKELSEVREKANQARKAVDAAKGEQSLITQGKHPDQAAKLEGETEDSRLAVDVHDDIGDTAYFSDEMPEGHPKKADMEIVEGVLDRAREDLRDLAATIEAAETVGTKKKLRVQYENALATYKQLRDTYILERNKIAGDLQEIADQARSRDEAKKVPRKKGPYKAGGKPKKRTETPPIWGFADEQRTKAGTSLGQDLIDEVPAHIKEAAMVMAQMIADLTKHLNPTHAKKGRMGKGGVMEYPGAAPVRNMEQASLLLQQRGKAAERNIMARKTVGSSRKKKDLPIDDEAAMAERFPMSETGKAMKPKEFITAMVNAAVRMEVQKELRLRWQEFFEAERSWRNKKSQEKYKEMLGKAREISKTESEYDTLTRDLDKTLTECPMTRGLLEIVREVYG